MPVPVQSELEPMGKYFLIRAMHIDVNGVRLDKVINEVKSSIESIKTDYYTKQQADDKFAAKTDVYTKSEVDTALSGKVSVQSGYGLISDAEKAQIQTNKANITAAETAIAGKASQEEVDTIKSDVAGKASTEAVTQLQTDMSVQTARMDQLVGTVPAGSADEIADARVTADGKTEANLGNAIRSQVSGLKETIDTNVSDLKGEISKTREINNFFHVDDFSSYGVTLTNNADGTITLNGTQQSYNNDVQVCELPVGKYTAFLKLVSGSMNPESGVSIRINNGRWVNVSNPVVTLDVNTPTAVFMRIGNGSVLTNAVLNIIIKSGTEVDESDNWVYSATDYTARKLINKNADDISDTRILIENLENELSHQTRNLAEYKGVVGELYGLTVATNEDGSITINGTATNTNVFDFGMFDIGTYTAGWNDEASVDGVTLRHGILPTTSNTARWLNNTNNKITKTFDTKQNAYLFVNGGVTLNNAVFKIEIESGNAVGDYIKHGITAFDREAQQKIEKISKVVDDLNKSDESTWRPLLDEAKKKMLSHNTNGRKLNFAVITDTHVYPEKENTFVCADNIVLFREASKYVDFAVHCGDVVESGNMTNTGYTVSDTMSKSEWLKHYDMAVDRFFNVPCPLYIVRGNHDVNQYVQADGTKSDEQPITLSEWDSLVRQYAGNVVRDSVQPHNAYYYCDYDDFKVRVVVLNQYNGIKYSADNAIAKNYGAKQMKWFAETALNFTSKSNPKEWGVVVFTHGLPYYSTETTELSHIRQILYSYNRGQDFTSADINVDAKFSTQGTMDLIAVIHGDVHEDTYDSATNSAIKFNSIGIDQSFVKSWAATSTGETEDNAEFAGAKKYCVDIFTIDTENKIMYETRIGRGKSRIYTYGSIDISGANSRTFVD